MQSKEHDKNAPPLKKLLPVRVQTVLQNVFNDENIFAKPEIIAAKGEKVFLTWKNLGRIGVMQLVTALESLRYEVDNRFSNKYNINPPVKTGKNILRNYYNYYAKHRLDDSEYIPIVRIIIESIVQSINSEGMKPLETEKIGEYLKEFNRHLYENGWLKHAREDEGTSVDEEKELNEARLRFNYMYEYGVYP